jgi:dienelactone hydrolase
MSLLIAKWRRASVITLLISFSQLSLGQTSAPVRSGGASNGFLERAVSFPFEKTELRATLTLPAKQDGKVPAVLFVSASAPHIPSAPGEAKEMFADLARGLAATGIASLRYEELTFDFSAVPDRDRLPLDVQIVNPALGGIEYLSRVPEIDASAILVAGHGLGGTLAPYIAARHSHVRGVILMAAAALPLEKSLAEQRKKDLQARGVATEQIEQQLAAQNRIFGDMRSGKMPSGRIVEGATVAYWRDRMNRDAGLKARDLKIPVLVLQGGFDTETTENDYDRLQSLLRRKRGATADFRWFPKLNHFFRTTESAVGNKSEAQSGNFNQAVVETIARWVKSR